MNYSVSILLSISLVLLAGCHVQKHKDVPTLFDYEEIWTYVDVKEAFKATIIEHKRNYVTCGRAATASVSMVRTGDDTLRVIALCNTNDYSIGSIVMVSPQDAPNFHVSLPLNYEIADSDKITDAYISREYDLSILETIWAKLEQ